MVLRIRYEDPCPFCRRDFTTCRNPLKAKKSPFLEAVGHGHPECISCRNTQSGYFKARGKPNPHRCELAEEAVEEEAEKEG